MAVSEEFEPLLKEVVSAKRLSASKMNRLTELALKGIEHDSQLVSILYRTHKSLPMTSKVSSLYAFDALARAARSHANKSGIVGDINSPTGNCATFLLKMEGVLDGLVQDLMATHSSEIQEKLRKVLDIWTKAGTFPPHVLARLSDMTIKKKDSPAPAPPQDPRIQAGPQAPMMVSPPPPPIAVAPAPAPQAPPPVPIATAPPPVPDVSLLMSILNAAPPPTQPAPASNPLAFLNGANGQPQIAPNITDAAGALALIQQLASASQQPPAVQSFPPHPPAPVQQRIPVPLPLAALTAGRNGVPPQHQGYPPVQYPNTNGAGGHPQHPQHPLNVRSPPRPPGPRPHDYRSRSRSPPRGPGGARWAPPAGPRNFSRDRERGRDDFRGRERERSRERFRDDRGAPPFRERDWDRRRRSFSRSRSPPPRGGGRFAPQGPRRDVRPYSPPRRPSNPTAASAAGGVGREEVRVAQDSGKDEFGRDIRARSGSPDDEPRNRPAADDMREVDMEQETPPPPPAKERPAPILTSASGTAPVTAGRPDADRDTNASAAGGGTEGGLETFNFAAFNFGEPASWQALGKAWHASYGSAPTQEQLVTLLMGNANPQNNNNSVNTGAAVPATASGGGSGMMPVGQPIQTFVDSDRDQDPGSWRGGGGGRGGWRGGFRERGRGGGVGGGHVYGGGGYGHAGAGGHINGEWGFAGPGDASDPYGGSDAIVLGGGD